MWEGGPLCGEEALCVGRRSSVQAEIYFYERRMTYLVSKASARFTEGLLFVEWASLSHRNVSSE